MLQKPTKGYYWNNYYPEQGIIIAMNNLGPSKAAKGLYGLFPSEFGPIVPLSQYSDVIYLEWQHLTSAEQRKGLKYVGRSNIGNRASINVIFAVLEDNGIANGPPKWPGAEFAMDQDSGKVMR